MVALITLSCMFVVFINRKTSKMEEQFNQLTSLIDDGLVLSDFYSITLNSSGLNLQGYYTATLVKKYKDAGFSFSLDGNQYLTAMLGGIEITLTDKR